MQIQFIIIDKHDIYNVHVAIKMVILPYEHNKIQKQTNFNCLYCGFITYKLDLQFFLTS
jgi:hypothetical protein